MRLPCKHAKLLTRHQNRASPGRQLLLIARLDFKSLMPALLNGCDLLGAMRLERSSHEYQVEAAYKKNRLLLLSTPAPVTYIGPLAFTACSAHGSAEIMLQMSCSFKIRLCKQHWEDPLLPGDSKGTCFTCRRRSSQQQKFQIMS